MKRCLTALVSLGLLAAPLATASALARGDDSVASAVELKREHKLKAAERVLERVLERDPGSLEGNLTMGLVKDDEYEDQAAVPFFQKAASEHSDSLEAQVMLVHSYIWADRIGDAQRQVDKTLAAWEKKEHDKSLWAKLLIGQGGVLGIRAKREGPWAAIKFGMAVRGKMESAYALDPTGAMELYAVGNYYLQAPGIAGGNPRKGLDYMARAVKTEPYNPRYRLDYLRSLRKSGRPEDFKREQASFQGDFAEVPAALAAAKSL